MSQIETIGINIIIICLSASFIMITLLVIAKFWSKLKTWWKYERN